jgi:hypothetical protein
MIAPVYDREPGTDSPMGFGDDLGGLLSPEVVAASWAAVKVVSAFLGGLAAEAA